jgi:microcystin degradation protein MlrC
MAPRIAVLRCWFEGNSFTPRPTTLDDFYAREWVSGDAALAFYGGTRTELGAAVDFAHTQPVGTVQFLRCAAASPGGPLTDACWRALQGELLEPLAALHRGGRLDGVYLSLHGAMICEGEHAPDRVLLAAVRRMLGPATPMAASFDLHANLVPAIARCADIVLGYKTYPHVDLYETGARALVLLDAAIAGRIRPVSAIVPARAILPSHGMNTASGPMRQIAARAAEMAGRPAVLDATPYGGFAYADTPHSGAGASVCIDAACLPTGQQARQLATDLASELAAALHAQRGKFRVRLPGPEQGLQRALRLLAEHGGPIAVLEPGDNPMSGGIGDTPGLFCALLAARPACPVVFSFFHDPGVVEQAFAAGLGAKLSVQLGGRVSSAYGAPAAFTGNVARLCDGEFRNEGPMEAGLACSWDRSAVLQDGSLRVVVTATCRSPNDPAWCRMHGIVLAELGLWCVKAKNHFRAAFAPHLRHIIDVDSPGPAALDLARLPYRHAMRAWLEGDAAGHDGEANTTPGDSSA